MQLISGNVAHPVDFNQVAITILNELANGEALQLFVTPHEDSPMK